MCSCIFNEYRLASLFGAGIPIVFIMIQMLSNMQGSMEGLKFATLLTLFDPQKLINGNNEGYLMLGGLLVVMIVCYGVGGIIFDRKRGLYKKITGPGYFGVSRHLKRISFN